MKMIYKFLDDMVPHAKFLKKRNDGEFLLLSSTGAYDMIYLNECAKDFFLLIDGKLTISDIKDSLEKDYDVSRDILNKDIHHLVRDLQWKGVVVLKNIAKGDGL